MGGDSVRRRLGRRVLLALGIALLWLPSTADAVAHPAAPPVSIATPKGEPGQPVVAVDGAGGAVLAWEEGSRLRLATRARPGGRWHVSGRSFPGGRRPQLATDSAGDAVLAFERWEGPALVLVTAFRPAGGDWGPAAPLSGDLGEGQGRWHLAMDAAGDAALVWSQYRHQEFPPLDAYYILAATMSAGSGSWSPPSELSAPTGGISPDLALGEDGRAIVAWRAYDEATRTLSVEAVFGSIGPVGAAWSTPSAVSGSGERPGEEGPSLAIGARGGALVAWGGAGGSCRGGLPSTLAVASVSPGGSWSAPTTISRPGECPVGTQLTIDPGGRATVLWESLSPLTTDLRAVSARAGTRGWTPPVHLARVGTLPSQFADCTDDCPRPPAGFARLMVMPGVGTLAAWRQEGVGVVGSLQAEGDWPRPKTLHQASGSVELALRTPAIAPGPEGEVLLVWTRWREIEVDAVHIRAPKSPAG